MASEWCKKSMFSTIHKLYISGKLLQFVGELCKKKVILKPNLVVGARKTHAGKCNNRIIRMSKNFRFEKV